MTFGDHVFGGAPYGDSAPVELPKLEKPKPAATGAQPDNPVQVAPDDAPTEVPPRETPQG